jgi:uncharacterized YigZ family protein
MQGMSGDSYRTIRHYSRGLYKDRGSKFFAFACPVQDEDEIKDILEKLRREYHDASHHCFAWKIGTSNQLSRANDDGEPSNTAGRPILGQIEKYDLTNILVVVVRYFGGTLLGTAGLIRAYREAGGDALKNSEIIIKIINVIIEIKFPFTAMNQVMKAIKEEQGELLRQDFNNECNLIVSVWRQKSGQLTGKLKRIENVYVGICQGSY